jgi:hypothetical protein
MGMSVETLESRNPEKAISNAIGVTTDRAVSHFDLPFQGYMVLARR